MTFSFALASSDRFVHISRTSSPQRVRAAVRTSASHRGDRLVADRSHVTFKDPTTERWTMVYQVNLPASNMGLEFKDVGYGPPVVANIPPGGYAAAYTDIKVGDVLLRCSALEIDVHHPHVKPRNFEFDALEPTPTGRLPSFETCMNALRSTAVYSAGFKHLEVTCEFKRDIDDRAEHEDYARLMETMTRVGRLEADRENAGDYGPRAPGEHPEGTPSEPLYVPDDGTYPVDD